MVIHITFSLWGGSVFLVRGNDVVVVFIRGNFVFHYWLDMTIKDKANRLKQ